MKTVFAVDYDDGKIRAKAGAEVPADLLKRKGPWLVQTGLVKKVPTAAKEARDGNAMTVKSYVDDYIAGKWRTVDAPPEVEQFAANHTKEIEAEFVARKTIHDLSKPVGDESDD